MSDIRYYMGRHKIGILSKDGKKAIIMHLENGYVGNKSEGYKHIHKYDKDIAPMRLLRRKKNE